MPASGSFRTEGGAGIPPSIPAIVLTIVFALAAACGRGPDTTEPHLVSRTHVTMGSEMSVSVWTSRTDAAEAAIGTVFAEFDRLDALLSVWKPESDVERLNAMAGRAPVPVHQETREVLQTALRMSEWTAGKFDITFGALADVWKFDQDQDNRVPTRTEIDARLPFVDYALVKVDEPPGTAFITRAGARVHLGGIGKGYAVDRSVSLLRAAGFQDFMIQAGGDLYVGGQRGTTPWRLGIRDPRGPADDSFAVLQLRDQTFSTSGDYERFFIKDGRRYHHIIDPDLGEPARLAVSVTIVSDRAVLADALSTGVFILGPEAGMGLVERLPNVEAVMVTADNRVLVSSGLKDRLQMLHLPTGTRP